LIIEFIINRRIEPLADNPWFGVSAETIIMLGAKYNPLMHKASQAWRFVTPMFLHVGILHYVFNMMLQIPIGLQLERGFGWWRIAFIYVVSGVGGNLLSCLFLPRLVEVGASSSIYGLISVYFVDIVANWRYYKSPGKKLILWIVTTVVSLIMGLLPYVDNFAHIGGSIAGIFATMIVIPTMFGSRSISTIVLRIIGVILTLLFFVPGFVLFYTNADVSEYCHWCEKLSCSQIWEWCRENADPNWN